MDFLVIAVAVALGAVVAPFLYAFLVFLAAVSFWLGESVVYTLWGR